MYYSNEEQETNINYDGITKTYLIYSTVPKHIKRLEKLPYVAIRDIEKDPEGLTIGITLLFKKLPSASTFNK